MSEENTPETKEAESVPGEVIEVPWEVAQSTFDIRRELLETKKYLSELLLEQERRKSKFLDRLSMLENAMYDSATSIQKSMDLNPEWTYEFKLPAKEGDKAYFIHKQD